MEISDLKNIIILSILAHSTLSDDPCGDWTPYKNEKCLKIFNAPGLLDYENAENYCKSTDQSNLISIGFEEKQQFLVDFLKSNEIFDNVWIGLKYTNNDYEWLDNSELHYTNWAPGSPKNDSDHCVQIQTDEQEFGKWSDVQCVKKNLVICEKLQQWAFDQLQNSIIELQFYLNQSLIQINDLKSQFSQSLIEINQLKIEANQSSTEINQLKTQADQSTTDIGQIKTQVGNLENEVTDVSKNPFPIGFIYAQLPNEKAPSEIWNWMQWQDISGNYAGVFFRVEGGGSAAFGAVQEENAPRLTHVGWGSGPHQTSSDDVDVVPGATTNYVDTRHADNRDEGFKFTESGGEIRPRNMAIRIWKRIS